MTELLLPFEPVIEAQFYSQPLYLKCFPNGCPVWIPRPGGTVEECIRQFSRPAGAGRVRSVFPGDKSPGYSQIVSLEQIEGPRAIASVRLLSDPPLLMTTAAP